MKTTFITSALFALLIIPGSIAQADYSLPDITDRVVLLVDRSQIQISNDLSSLSIAGVATSYQISQFWMQDRIWSDGICVGIDANSKKSAESRIREIVGMQAHDPAGKPNPVLLEMVHIKNKPTFVVSYMQIFDPAADYAKHFPKGKKYGHGEINLKLKARPKSASALRRALRKQTKRSLVRLRKLARASKP